MLKDYDAAFLPHCWFLFTLWWGCWYANIRSQCKVSDTIKAFGPLVDLTLAYHVWHMKRCVADIHDPDHERLCRVHSGSWYDEVDLWPQDQIDRVYDMALCLGHGFFVLCQSHTMFGSRVCQSHTMFGTRVCHSHIIFGTWVCHHDTMCRVHSWPLYDLERLPQYQNFTFTMNLTLAR